MATAIVEIVAAIAKIAAFIVGDHYVSKWLAAVKFFLERQATPKMKEQILAEYVKLQLEFDRLLEKDRAGGKQ